MSFLKRFSMRKAQTREIPSGAYEDYLDTVITGPESYGDIDGPKTLMEGLPEREKELVPRVPEEQQQRPETAPSFSGETLADKMEFDPSSLDKRVYKYIEEVASPAMMEAEQVLFFLQKAIVEGWFGEGHQENQTDFVQTVDFSIEMVDQILEHLSDQAAAAYSKMDHDEKYGDISEEDIQRFKEDWTAQGDDFKEMLQRVGDPFKPEPSMSDPFVGEER